MQKVVGSSPIIRSLSPLVNVRAQAERVPTTISEDVNLEGVEAREAVASA